ncbi:RsmE family RNA methyltransferase [Lacunisphaera limnophila]|nr:RsmE family RNA methyltransferase [Lacunisphaera limnophila]
MNIILFSLSEVELPLPRSDFRARHIMEVLRRRPGDIFDAGLINGPRGQGTLVAVDEHALTLSFVWGKPPRPLSPIRLLVGLPRPQTARDILREGASLGVAAMDFVRLERGESSYAQSTLWTSREWETLLVTGAAQAFCTRLPEVRHGHTLAEAVATLPGGVTRIVLDNYEATEALGNIPFPTGTEVVLALGAERGWTPAERTWLRQNGFQFAHLGERVLRLETACIAAVAVLKARLGWP